MHELIDRQHASVRTGDATADMVIADLERRLNRNADIIERMRAGHLAEVERRVNEAREKALEDAAKFCDEIERISDEVGSYGEAIGARSCADDIRALKVKP